ncbi:MULTISPECIES: NAD kinase [Virgibacillus]|uniref:NAD kinase n=1 Tax=Virgibacillus pantothenticus TaxID=1473 RepID=A0A0L0QQH0_VIRPA|nr:MULTISPECIES: NAD kinase [Virgibacillus]API90849.1 NAD kinase [Virgibacillus sp. 6R]KNE20796.1 inorganic polyphosphate kinase [Virgibacillus pantothenticus]MBS7426715.1 NAD kinase [Virgibacillus sp. 19R1-5]MBU8566043.1 NAD kinase [Virgibacillus pantothenticus]MBU8602784.1 NAD kinase [Virgibacillus pantothenticus]
MTERNNIFFYYVTSKGIEEKLSTLSNVAIENGFEIVEHAKNANIIVSIGGDGAFLQAARKTGYRQDCLYIGINRSGESSLYCDFNMDNFDEMLDTMQHEELEVRRFPIIHANVNGETSFYCLNEISVRSTIIKSIVIDVYIDDQHFETFRGDGLIVATPTGSTGYNKSTNGAVIDPRIPCFQVTELASINNNRYRTLGSSFILNQDRKLRLSVRQDGNDYPIIGLDNEAYSIRNIHDITVTLSDKVVKTVKLKNNSFWDRVKRTFL